MNALLLACLFFPLGTLLLIQIEGRSEQAIASISTWSTHVWGLCVLSLLGLWAQQGFTPYTHPWISLYSHGNYAFTLHFFLDRVGAVYLFCLWVIFSVIVRYCRYYLHREAGYKRFFLTIFGFAFGLNLLILADSLDQLFAGWEIVGMCSFLLIAFYRDREQPLRNALRAYSVYRFCDIGLLLGAWMMQAVFHGSMHLSDMPQWLASDAFQPSDNHHLLLLAFLLIIAACGKSAQFPFCYWLPRAMEGPTPSSAVFYGALSVHLGVFLLLRTLPIWSHDLLPRIMVFLIGLVSAVIASLSQLTQSSIKGQIAYASITQVGFMFMELALGLESWVLVHFLGNAFLRCYQLLVSPSIVAHRLRTESPQIDIHPASDLTTQRWFSVLPQRARTTLHVIALQEGNLEPLVKKCLWDTLKSFGARLNRIAAWQWATLFSIIASLMLIGFAQGWLQAQQMAIVCAVAMLLAAMDAFAQKRNPYRKWNATSISSIFAAASLWLLHPESAEGVILFLTGIVPGWIIGLLLLVNMLKNDIFSLAPYRYRALAEIRPRLALAFFFCVLAVVGFPVTPAFIGEDLLLHYIEDHQAWLAAMIALAFVLNGVAGAALFLRLCMGRPIERPPEAAISTEHPLKNAHPPSLEARIIGSQ